MNVEKVWKNGEMMEENLANISVLSHALHYGSSFFEGIRAYQTFDGKTAVFRLREHMQRLHESTKIYRTQIPYSVDELMKATEIVLKTNQLKEAYIRPLVFRGKGTLGVDPSKCPVEMMIAAWNWGAYLGKEGMEKGIDVQVSSWRRFAPDTLPSLAKAGGNYLSSQLIKMEALENGYDEGIALDYQGNISEGSGENIFVIKNSVIFTPPIASSALFGITRDSVITLAREMGMNVSECTLPREFLYTADEVFFSGTAAEITPIRSIDKIIVGNGKAGELTKELQNAFFDAARGKNETKKHWLHFVE